MMNLLKYILQEGKSILVSGIVQPCVRGDGFVLAGRITCIGFFYSLLIIRIQISSSVNLFYGAETFKPTEASNETREPIIDNKQLLLSAPHVSCCQLLPVYTRTILRHS